MAHNCPECGTDVADDDRIVCEFCDTPPVLPILPPHFCGCCGFLVPEPDNVNARCEGCRAGDAENRCDPAITGHDTWFPYEVD